MGLSKQTSPPRLQVSGDSSDKQKEMMPAPAERLCCRDIRRRPAV
jgi:hypothetical protein